MLFRVLPVLVWSFAGSLVGTALAVYAGFPLSWRAFLLVLAIAALVQGYPTHIINEIVDCKSGADDQSLGTKKFGGSKVLQAGLLTFRDLWAVFFVSHLLLLGLVWLCAKSIDTRIVYLFILPGYLSGLFYSLPPFRFAYRPFLGEWLGGFSGIFFLVLGSYYAQTLKIDAYALSAACGLGLVYIGIMVFFHYLDFENDQRAKPRKTTTVVFLGLKGSRVYSYLCLAFASVLFAFWTVKFRAEGLAFLVLSGTVLFCHHRICLTDPLSIIRWGKLITLSALVVALGFAAVADAHLAFMGLPAILGFWAHKKFGKLKGLRPSTSS